MRLIGLAEQENKVALENEKPWWVGQFESEDHVREVFDNWIDLLRSTDGWDRARVIDLLAIISHYSDLDLYPFIFESLKHPSGGVRISAANALAECLSESLTEKGMARLLKVLEKDSNPHVQGAALDGLGRVSRDHQLQQFISLFLERIHDRNLDNIVRISAYTGLIYAFDREGEPNYHPFEISFSQPADEQIDWDWIDELSEQYLDKEED